MATPVYVAIADLYTIISEDTVAELTDDDVGAEVVETDVTNSLLAYAEALVDSYVGGRYPVPLATPVPNAVEWAVLTITKYRLYQRRDRVSDDMQTEYDQVMEWLQMVREGEADLPITTDVDAIEYGQGDTTEDGNMIFNDDEKVFGR